MKLMGELKAKVDSAAGMEEKKALIAEAGMELNDEELAAVAGGICLFIDTLVIVNKPTPVFMSPGNPHIFCTLRFGTKVKYIDGSERDGGSAMSNYSPLIRITSPVSGWIPKSSIEQ